MVIKTNAETIDQDAQIEMIDLLIEGFRLHSCDDDTTSDCTTYAPIVSGPVVCMPRLALASLSTHLCTYYLAILIIQHLSGHYAYFKVVENFLLTEMSTKSLKIARGDSI